jgi:hypothetical protein
MEKEDTDKLLRLKREIDLVSGELTKKAGSIDADVITIRNDPEIRKIWNRLCRLHMKGVIACEFDPKGNKETVRICEEILQPRACIDALHLSEEETCCGRFLKRIRETKQ